MSTRLVNQPTAAPTRKVSAATVAAFAAPFLVDVVEMYVANVPPTFEPFMFALLVFAAGYFVRERDDPRAIGT